MSELTKRPDESQTAFAIRCIKAEAWDEAVKSAYLHETENWLGIMHAPNPYRAPEVTGDAS